MRVLYSVHKYRTSMKCMKFDVLCKALNCGVLCTRACSICSAYNCVSGDPN